MRLRSTLTAAVVIVAGFASSCGQSPPQTGVVASGECPREKAVVRRALDRSSLQVDVDGDGRLDTVAVASQPDAPKPCRAFVGVRVKGGSTYSAHLIARAAPLKGLEARIVGLPRLGDDAGAEIVVDTRAAVDSLLAQMFALTDQGLREVGVPGFEDGTFIVEGGGVVYPHGAACTADGQLVLSRAAQTTDGRRFRVSRRTFEVEDSLRLVRPTRELRTVPLDDLLDRFPEFGRPHWTACTGTVRR